MPFSTLNKTIPLPDKRPFPKELQTIGDHIKQARLQRRIMIKDVIAELQIDRETLRGWELGLFEPHVRHFPRIIRFLDYFPFEIETNTLGGRIKKFRYLNGLSQEQFAVLLNTNRGTVCFWETNRRLPVSKTISKLNKILNGVPKQSCFPEYP